MVSLEWLRTFFIDVCPIISRGCALLAVLIFSGATRLPDVAAFASEWISATTLLLLCIKSSPAALLSSSPSLVGYAGLTSELLDAIMGMPSSEDSSSNVLPDKVDFMKHHMHEVQDAPESPCSICWDDPAQTPIRLPCKHIFCKECLVLWFAKSDSCPMCHGRGRIFEPYHRKTAHYVKAWTLLAFVIIPVSLAAQAGNLIQKASWIGIAYSPVSFCFITASEFKMAYETKGSDWWRDMMLTSIVQGKIMRRLFPIMMLGVALVGLLPIAIAV